MFLVQLYLGDCYILTCDDLWLPSLATDLASSEQKIVGEERGALLFHSVSKIGHQGMLKWVNNS